jgi:hypothetical protein
MDAVVRKVVISAWEASGEGQVAMGGFGGEEARGSSRGRPRKASTTTTPSWAAARAARPMGASIMTASNTRAAASRP